MKTLFSTLVLVCCASAQTPPPPVTPASPAASEFAPDTVVATSDGKKITAGEVNKIMQNMPLQMRQTYERDPKSFLSQWFLLERLNKMAEETKLQDKSPYKDTLAVQRMTMMAQFMIDDKSRQTQVSDEDLKKAYESKKDDYTMAKVKLVYVPFITGQAQTVAGAQKTMTEAEALAKAEDVVKKARAGGDFVKLVAENSEDPISKDRQGDFGPIRRGDKLPDNIKQAVFSLKPGDVADPVRQPNGYYVFRLQELTPQPLEDIKETLFNELKNARVKEWMDSQVKAVEVKVEKPEFFTPNKPR